MECINCSRWWRIAWSAARKSYLVLSYNKIRNNYIIRDQYLVFPIRPFAASPRCGFFYGWIFQTKGRITVTRRVLELQFATKVSNMPNLYRALIVAAVLLGTPSILSARNYSRVIDAQDGVLDLVLLGQGLQLLRRALPCAQEDDEAAHFGLGVLARSRRRFS